MHKDLYDLYGHTASAPGTWTSTMTRPRSRYALMYPSFVVLDDAKMTPSSLAVRKWMVMSFVWVSRGGGTLSLWWDRPPVSGTSGASVEREWWRISVFYGTPYDSECTQSQAYIQAKCTLHVVRNKTRMLGPRMGGSCYWVQARRTHFGIRTEVSRKSAHTLIEVLCVTKMDTL